MRFSTTTQTAYIATPMMAMANRPAKVVGAFVARAGRQHEEADAAVAADRLGDHRADERERDRDLEAGEQVGHGTRNADLAQDLEARAPRLLSTSIISGSMVARPVATLTTIGKKLMTPAVMTAGSAPTPTQIIRIGTIATLARH